MNSPFPVPRFLFTSSITERWGVVDSLAQKHNPTRRILDGLRHWTEPIERYRLAYRLNLASLTAGRRVRAVERIVRHRLLGDGKLPIHVVFAPTYLCQCRCGFCAMNRYGDEETLTLEEIRAILTRIAALGAVKLSFFGGEPLCHPQILDMVHHAGSLGLVPGIDTNGILLGPKMVKRLKQAGLGHAFVSLDSTDPYTHDAIRGYQGCHYRAVRAIELCIDAGITASFSVYLSRANVHGGEIERIVAFGRRLGAASVRLVLPSAMGGLQGRGDVSLTEEEYDYVRSLLDSTYVYIESQKYHMGQCAAARDDMLFISPSGNVMPCPYVPVTFGSLRDEDISAIWEGMQRKMRSLETCRGCISNAPQIQSLLGESVGCGGTLPVPFRTEGEMTGA